MRIAIFGGTGATGQLLLQQALEAGHDVTAFARAPAKLPQHERLTAVEGQLRDADAVAEAVKGAEAVLSLLGPTRKSADAPELADGYRAIVDAMRTHHVERLVATGTPSITDPADGKDLKISLMVKGIKKFQPVAYNTLLEIGQIIRNSGLKWTIVRLPLLTNGPRTEARVRAIGARGGVRLSRANAAAYFLQQATDITQVGRAPFIIDA